MIHQPVSVVSQCGAGAWLNGLASGDQRRLTGSGSASEACSRRCAIQIHRYFTLLLPVCCTIYHSTNLKFPIFVMLSYDSEYYNELYMHVCLHVLCNYVIINSLIQTSPSVTPVFKKRISSDVNNYRPISLTCCCCKIMESIITD